MKQGISRRSFLATSALAGFSIAADAVYGQNVAKGKQQLRFVKVGAGGMGRADLQTLINQGAMCVGICDVNPDTRKSQAEKYKLPEDRVFSDYRKLFDKLGKEFDAVCVSTPDHTHATIALSAMRMGKHVYVQKPLAHSFEECEMLMAAAKKYGVVTQMGTQHHPESYRYQKLLENNFWGDIREVHCWTDRSLPGRWWAQGMKAYPAKAAVPAGFDWDCWLGPAKYRDFGNGYQPGCWRGWWDFGCGAIGDMAVHNLDAAFFVLKLGLPETIKAWCDEPAGIAMPKYSTIDFHFGPTPVCPNGVDVYWYETGILPKVPFGAHPQLSFGDNGLMFVGSKTITAGDGWSGKPSCIAVTGQRYGAAVKEAEQECNKLLKGEGNWSYCHYKQWIDVAVAGNPNGTGSRFEYSAPFTQSLLLGCIAQRFPGKKLTWDNAKKEFKDNPEATAFLKGSKREGFEPRV